MEGKCGMSPCPYGADRLCTKEDCVCCEVYREWLYDCNNPPDPYDEDDYTEAFYA